MKSSPRIKIGVQSIIWGPDLPDLEAILDMLAVAGFEGIEFSQTPEILGRKAGGGILHLHRLLNARKSPLSVIGLAGGQLSSRIEYCGSERPPSELLEYLYVDRWDETCLTACNQGFTLGIHPHLFQPINRFEQAFRRVVGHPELAPRLKLIPDTAHLTIAGEDPVAAIRQARGRLASVHLKDWTPDYGRSYHRYARGFVELGRGIVKLDECVEALREIDYDGWLIVEQDSPSCDVVESLRQSVKWLLDRGLLPRGSRLPVNSVAIPTTWPPLDSALPSREDETRFTRTILRAAHQDSGSFYRAVAEAYQSLFGCDMVILWSYNPAYHYMTLLASRHADGLNHAIEPPTMKLINAISRECGEATSIVAFDLADPATLAPSVHKDIIQKLGLIRMVSVPVMNSWNSHHARFIVNLCSTQGDFDCDRKLLRRLAIDVGRAADAMLDGWCTVAAGQAAGACA